MMFSRVAGPIVVALLMSACSCAYDPKTALDAATATQALAPAIAKAIPTFRFVNEMAAVDDPGEIGAFKTLARSGFLKSYAAASLLGAASETHYRLTARGAELTPGWDEEGRGVYLVPVGKLRLLSITGVEMLSAGHAMVTYTYANELNSMGKLLRAGNEADTNYFDPLKAGTRDIRAADAPMSEAAEMQHYDDGWRSVSWTL